MFHDMPEMTPGAQITKKTTKPYQTPCKPARIPQQDLQQLVVMSAVDQMPGPKTPPHYNDVTMGVMASQITSLAIVYSTVYSDADQRKHQSSASLAFAREIHRWPVNSLYKWPVTWKMFPFDDVIMNQQGPQPVRKSLSNPGPRPMDQSTREHSIADALEPYLPHQSMETINKMINKRTPVIGINNVSDTLW